MNQHGQYGAGHHAFDDAPVGGGLEHMEPDPESFVAAKGAEAVLHQFQSEKEHADPHDRHAGIPQPVMLSEKEKEGGESQDGQTVFADLQHQNPAGNRRADIGPEDHPDGLDKCHEPAVDQSDGHHRGYRAGLDYARYGQAGQQAHHPVLSHRANHAAQAFTRDGLESVGHKTHSDEEDAEASDDLEKDGEKEG